MASVLSDAKVNISRLILIPAVISLGVTVIRLIGELQRWDDWWFSRAAGGGGSPIGVSWLALIFGIYFALKLAQAGAGPTSYLRAIGMPIVGIVIIFAAMAAIRPLGLGFQGQLLLGSAATVVAGLIQYPAWPALFKTLFAYGLAVRIPVAIVMLFAMMGNWGTHYDAVPPDFPTDMGLVAKYVWLGLMPQLTLWIAITIITGMLFGSVAAAIFARRKPLAHTAAG